MATDTGRRRWLGAALLSALAPWPATAAPRGTQSWVAAWSESTGHHIGVLQQAEGSGDWSVVARTQVPTRAHGLLALPNGDVLAVARRPGDWLMRWRPPTLGRKAAPGPTKADITWTTAHRSFNGHACLLPDGRHLLLTETDTASGDGLGEGRMTVRALDRPAIVLADWPTGGRDPHQLLVSPDGRHVWVANGGLASQPERGRTRLDSLPMDASLVAIDLGSGAQTQRWCAEDPWLSLRHLAWHAPSATLGIAVQAEHTDPAQRMAAPVLALLQPLKAGASLRCVDAGQPMAGYGGDLCATPEGFAVSSPRAGRLGRWDAQGQWLGAWDLDAVCAVGPTGTAVLAAGARQQIAWHALQARPATRPLPITPDTHWIPLP